MSWHVETCLCVSFYLWILTNSFLFIRRYMFSLLFLTFNYFYNFHFYYSAFLLLLFSSLHLLIFGSFLFFACETFLSSSHLFVLFPYSRVHFFFEESQFNSILYLHMLLVGYDHSKISTTKKSFHNLSVLPSSSFFPLQMWIEDMATEEKNSEINFLDRFWIFKKQKNRQETTQ